MCLSKHHLLGNGSLLVPQISQAKLVFRGVEADEDGGDGVGRNLSHLLVEGAGDPEVVGDGEPSNVSLPTLVLRLGEEVVVEEDEVGADDSTVFSVCKALDFFTR